MDNQEYAFDISDDEDLLADAQEVKNSADAAAQIAPAATPNLEDDLLADDAATVPPVKTAEELAAEATDDAPDGDETFQEISENLLKMGVFTLDEGEEKIEVKSTEAFVERWQKENQKAAINTISGIVGQYGPEYAEAWDVIFNKGLNPYEYFGRTQNIETYEAMELEGEENIDNQKMIVRTALKMQGFTPERIEAKLQKFVELGELEEEAKDFHQVLVTREKQELQTRATQAEAQRQYEAKMEQQHRQVVFNTLSDKLKAKEYDGIPVTQKVAEQTYDFMFEPRVPLEDGKVVTTMEAYLLSLLKPENHALAVKFALLAQNNFDTTKITKKALSKENDKLFQKLTHKNKQEQRNTPNAAVDFFLD